MDRRQFLIGTASMACAALTPAPALPSYINIISPMPIPKMDDARLVLPDNNLFRFLSDGD